MEQTRQLWEESEEQSPASWLVCVTDRPLPHRLDRLTASAEELSKATGKTCLAAQADVRHPEQLRRELFEKYVCERGEELKDVEDRLH